MNKLLFEMTQAKKGLMAFLTMQANDVDDTIYDVTSPAIDCNINFLRTGISAKSLKTFQYSNTETFKIKIL